MAVPSMTDVIRHVLRQILAVRLLSQGQSVRPANDDAVRFYYRVTDGEVPEKRDRNDYPPKSKWLGARGDLVNAVCNRQAEYSPRHQQQEPSNLSLKSSGMNEKKDESRTGQQYQCPDKCPSLLNS